MRKVGDFESEISSWSPLVLSSSDQALPNRLDSGAWRTDLKGSELQQDRLGFEHVDTQVEQPHRSWVQSPQCCDSFPSHSPAVTSRDPCVVAARRGRLLGFHAIKEL